MDPSTLFVVIVCNNNSPWGKIADKIGTLTKRRSKRLTQNKHIFLRQLEKRFKVKVKKRIPTAFTYPTEARALRSLQMSHELWYRIRFSQAKKKKLQEIVKKYRQGRRRVIPEEVFFYVLQRRSVMGLGS